MRIPKNPQGFPTLHTSHIRTYGAGGFALWDGHEVGGCPAQYKARYEDHKVTSERKNDALLYGTTIHRTLHVMEAESIGPEEALERVWAAELPISRWREAKDDLDRYMTRGSPTMLYGTLAVERYLEAPLYEDEDFGPVWFGGSLDWLGIDVENPWIVHVVDYKSGWTVPNREEVRNDIQLMGYDWLVHQNWEDLGLTGRPQTVCHLDAIKWKDIEVRFTEHQLSDWVDWAAAIARRILHDEDAKEVLNPGCGWCPIKMDCKAYRKLPGRGEGWAEKRSVADLPALIRWRDEAKVTIKNLKAGVDEIDEALKEKVALTGSVEVGDSTYAMEQAWTNDLDKARLLELLGLQRFLTLTSISKMAFDEMVTDLDPDLKAEAIACWSRIPKGETLKCRKTRKSDG